MPKTLTLENKEIAFWNSKKWDDLKNSIKIAVEENVNKIKSENPDLYAYAILPEVARFIVIWFSDSDSEILFRSVSELNSKEIAEEFNTEFK